MQQPNTNPQGQEIIVMKELQEIAELLVKHQGLHVGLYDLAIEFQAVIGGVRLGTESTLPGAMFGVKRIGLKQTLVTGTTTVDASVVNPFIAAKKIAAKKLPRK